FAGAACAPLSTLSLHDALPISNDIAAFVGLNDSSSLSVSDITDAAATNLQSGNNRFTGRQASTATSGDGVGGQVLGVVAAGAARSEEHTSELQSRENLVCRLRL